MASMELRLGSQKFTLKSDEPEEHLSQVAHLVQSRLDDLLHDHPGLTPTKAALLAAVEFASQTVQGREQVDGYRTTLLAKAGDILERIERELTPSAP